MLAFYILDTPDRCGMDTLQECVIWLLSCNYSDDRIQLYGFSSNQMITFLTTIKVFNRPIMSVATVTVSPEFIKDLDTLIVEIAEANRT